MPRSTNRRAMEVPTAIYERLYAEAVRDGRTTAQVAVDVLTDGWDAREHHGRVVDEIHEVRIELERMRRQVADLAALVRGLAELVRGLAATHHGESPTSIPAGEGTARPRRWAAPGRGAD